MRDGGGRPHNPRYVVSERLIMSEKQATAQQMAEVNAIIFNRGDGRFDLLPAGLPGHICENIPHSAVAEMLAAMWNGDFEGPHTGAGT